jgi:hypothetical protein
MNPFFKRFLSLFVILLLTACNMPATEEAFVPQDTQQTELEATTEEPVLPVPTDTLQPTATVEHFITPGTGAPSESNIADTISGDTAHQGVSNQPPGGDYYLNNLYERPFNALTQDVFFPDLDIRSAELGLKQAWMYVTIHLYGLRPEANALEGRYGIEIDLNVDGRGEWLILADAPFTSEWSVNGVRAWNDTNANVGQTYPCYADPPQTSDSYDALYFDQGQGVDPDAAWVRLLPGEPPTLQIAFKHAMINNDVKFMWGVWSDQGLDQPQWFDYHDHFTYDEAGSPLVANSQYYPMKAIAELDNTCRWAYGFMPVGTEPCLCAGGVPTPTPTVLPRAGLGGYAYKDLNGSGVRDAGDGGFGGLNVNVRSGHCPGGAIVATGVTGAYGRYTVLTLMPGAYCVITPDFGTITCTPVSYDVTLAPGEFRDELNFRYTP